MTQNFTHGDVYALTGPCSMSSPCPGSDAPPERHGAACAHHYPSKAVRQTKRCDARRCNDPALWRVDYTDHPNGAPVMWLCNYHATLASVWDEAPRPYTITISGPHR